MTGYVVAVKPSARRTNGIVGRLVSASGPSHGFGSRADADDWATALSADEPTVWVRDANPNDAEPVDGYLVGRHRPPTRAPGGMDAVGMQSTLAVDGGGGTQADVR